MNVTAKYGFLVKGQQVDEEIQFLMDELKRERK